MTESRQYVRVLLYGCSHKPKFSAMACPKRGDTLYCHVCNRGRVVEGIQTGWERAKIVCNDCSWTYQTKKLTKYMTFKKARVHADAWEHNVSILHDGLTTKVKPRKSEQLYLIDPLVMPDTDTKP